LDENKRTLLEHIEVSIHFSGGMQQRMQIAKAMDRHYL
jgi:ABC-type phosphonate transport system ATPase subunit